MKTDAIRLAEKGMAVFPVPPRAKKPPLTRRGCLDASHELDQINEWWTRWPDANIAIATGEKSGIFVVDIDPDKGGEASLAKLEREQGELPSTVEVITGSGGRHLYFRLPDFDGAPQIKNSAGHLGDGLDVRGNGGYVMAPPSLHPIGKAYAWSVDSASAFADAPPWLLRLIGLPPASVAELNARRSTQFWLDLIKGVPEGERNHCAASLIGHLLRHHIHPRVILMLAACWNERNQPPLEARELVEIFQSIFQREGRRRSSL